MATIFKAPSDITTEILTNLKALKPAVNTDQEDSDWVIRAKTYGGVISGLYADQSSISDDAFPQSARHEALDRFLFMLFNGTFNPATQSTGNIGVNVAVSAFYPALTQLVYTPNGNTYQTTADTTIVSPSGTIPVQSVNTGAVQNLLTGASLKFSSPPVGSPQTATVITPGLSGAVDPETDGQAAARILARIRAPIAGGTVTDYQQFATGADPAVITAKVKRFIYGLGTVGVYITTGPDIDTAIDGNLPIIRTPSAQLLAEVQAAIDARKPLTDCAFVLSPSEASQDVTVQVKYLAGFSGSTIIAGQTLTLNQLVQREIKRIIYKIPVGGRVIGTTGYVLKSEIEEGLDSALSDEAYITGTVAQVIVDRSINDLSASGMNRTILESELVKPGTITVVEL